MDNNICKFAPLDQSGQEVKIINFVLENNPDKLPEKRLLSYHALYLVIDGSGTLNSGGGSYTLNKNDIFLSLAAKPFSLSQTDNLKYMYISFTCKDVQELLNKTQFSKDSLHFFLDRECASFWLDAITTVTSDNTEYAAKSVLYYTLSRLNKAKNIQEQTDGAQNPAWKIKRFLDLYYTDSELSLNYLSRLYHYNEKYLSTLFKEKTGTGISKYIQSLRIRQACVLLKQGQYSVKDIAQKIGYKDQLYFSKAFRAVMKVSPSQYLKNL